MAAEEVRGRTAWEKGRALVLLLLALVTTDALAQTITGRVVRIVDGDTFVLLVSGNTQEKVRLAGIDCPEQGQAFGTKAKEAVVLGDRASTRNDRNPDAERLPGEPVWAFPFKRQKGQDLPAEQAEINRWLASLRAAVEHPFRLLKRHSATPRSVTGACTKTGSRCSCYVRSVTCSTCEES